MSEELSDRVRGFVVLTFLLFLLNLLLDLAEILSDVQQVLTHSFNAFQFVYAYRNRDVLWAQHRA